MRLKTSTIALFAALSLHAQGGMDAILDSIESNNTTLLAARKAAEAEKTGNRTGIFMADPEVEVGYHWGNPSEVGTRTTVSVRQSIDIPTIAGMRSKAANGKSLLADLRYNTERMGVLLEAKLCYLDIVYYNAMLAELDKRRHHATLLLERQQERLASGDGNALEVNNVRLSLAALRGETARNEAERDALLIQLKRLNGDRAIAVTTTQYDTAAPPADFNEWYCHVETRWPALAYAILEVELGKRELSLSRAEQLPSFSVGYVSEQVVGQGYRGVAVGMSVPLWANRNKIRQARAALSAAEARRNDAGRQARGVMESLHKRAASLRKAADIHRKALTEADNTAMLKAALDEGEISIIDYLQGIALYYGTADQALQAERDYHKVLAELNAVLL